MNTSRAHLRTIGWSLVSATALIAPAQIVSAAATTPTAGTAMTPPMTSDMATKIPAYISAAIADSSRSDADKARDPLRKPDLVLTFAGVKPGDKVGELMPGRGYYTNILCKAVGESGHVSTVTIKRVTPPPAPPPGAPSAPAGGPPPPPPPPAGSKPCTNITGETQDGAALALPAGLDVVWTTENYHDFHNKMFGAPDMTAFNKAVFDALKPGGVYIIEDHAAVRGAGTSVTETLHRIDEASVVQEVTAVGFVVSGESDILVNTGDPRDVKVFDLKGESSKFLLKFTKPKK